MTTFTVITRHPALIALLVERGTIPAIKPENCPVHQGNGCTGCPVLADGAVSCTVPDPEQVRIKAHALLEDVAGQHVIGVLPMHLAAEAASYTEVPLNAAPEDRGKEIPLSRLREIAGAPVTYMVTRI